MKRLEELKNLADNLKKENSPNWDQLDAVVHNVFTLGDRNDIQEGIDVLENLFLEALDSSKNQNLKTV